MKSMNQVAFFEIHVGDPVRAIKFYEGVFGWKFTKDEHISIDYWRIDTKEATGGLLKRPVPAPKPEQGLNAFVSSIQVADFDVTSAAIIREGGMVALPKFAILGKCWQGYFIDTDANTFGIFQVDPEAA